MTAITGPYVLDFTGAQEGFVPVYRDAEPNHIAWEEAPSGGGSGTPAGTAGDFQFNEGDDFSADSQILRFVTTEGGNRGAIIAEWLIGEPVAFFTDDSTILNAITAVYGATFYQASPDGSARPHIAFVASRGTYAAPAASAGSDEIGNIGFFGTGTAGDFNSVNGISSITGRNRSSDPDAIVCDFEFLTAALELVVNYDGGITLTHVFPNGSDPGPTLSTAPRLYCVLTAGGKQQLAVQFGTGSPQIIKTEV